MPDYGLDDLPRSPGRDLLISLRDGAIADGRLPEMAAAVRHGLADDGTGLLLVLFADYIAGNPEFSYVRAMPPKKET